MSEIRKRGRVSDRYNRLKINKVPNAVSELFFNCTIQFRRNMNSGSSP